MRDSTVADGVKALLRQKVSVRYVPWWVGAMVLGVSWGYFGSLAVAAFGSLFLLFLLDPSGSSFGVDYRVGAILAFVFVAAVVVSGLTVRLSTRIWATTPPKNRRRLAVTTTLAALVCSGGMVGASLLV